MCVHIIGYSHEGKLQSYLFWKIYFEWIYYQQKISSRIKVNFNQSSDISIYKIENPHQNVNSSQLFILEAPWVYCAYAEGMYYFRSGDTPMSYIPLIHFLSLRQVVIINDEMSGQTSFIVISIVILSLCLIYRFQIKHLCIILSLN